MCYLRLKDEDLRTPESEAGKVWLRLGVESLRRGWGRVLVLSWPSSASNLKISLLDHIRVK